MTFSKWAVIATGAASALASTPATAAIATLNTACGSSGSGTNVFNSYADPAGLNLSTVAANGMASFERGDRFSADPTGCSVIYNLSNTSTEWMKVQLQDGSAFTLNSVDIAHLYNDGFPSTNRTVDYRLTNLDSSLVTGTLNLDSIPGYQTFSFGTTVLQAEFRRQAQFDNFNFTRVSAIPAVPEPATWAMMVAGFGLAGAALRKRAGEPALSRA